MKINSLFLFPLSLGERKMNSDEYRMTVEELMARLCQLKLQVTAESQPADAKTMLNDANQTFIAMLEAWALSTAQEELYKKFISAQNDFHYAANVLLARMPETFNGATALNEINQLHFGDKGLTVSQSGTSVTFAPGLEPQKPMDVEAMWAAQTGTEKIVQQNGTAVETQQQIDARTIDLALSKAALTDDLMDEAIAASQRLRKAGRAAIGIADPSQPSVATSASIGNTANISSILPTPLVDKMELESANQLRSLESFSYQQQKEMLKPVLGLPMVGERGCVGSLLEGYYSSEQQCQKQRNGIRRCN